MKTLFHYTLAIGMLVTGSLNTIVTYGANNINVVEYHDWFGKPQKFSHPFFQALCMFVGEALCFLAFRYQGYKNRGTKDEEPPANFPRIILCLPASCDMTATSVMYVGATLTTASSYQMLRGCVVVFTGLASWIFLKRKLFLHHWTGMGLVVIGTVIVGTSGRVCKSDNSHARNETAGNVLVILAQIVVSVQMVIEERLIGGYKIPALQVVGWEGIWGFCMLFIVLIIMYHVPQPKLLSPSDHPSHEQSEHFEDAVAALKDMGKYPKLLLFSLGGVISIAFFNFFGVSITKHLNAATRMVLDSLRTIVVWAVSLMVGWEKFCWIDIIGFVVLLTGTIIFNEIVYIPGLMPPKTPGEEGADKPLLVKEEEGGLAAVTDFATIATPTMGKLTTTKQR